MSYQSGKKRSQLADYDIAAPPRRGSPRQFRSVPQKESEIQQQMQIYIAQPKEMINLVNYLKNKNLASTTKSVNTATTYLGH